MVYIADDQSRHRGDMGKLLAVAIEEYRHRESRHHHLFNLLVSLLACNGLGQVPIKFGLVFDVLVVLKNNDSPM